MSDPLPGFQVRRIVPYRRAPGDIALGPDHPTLDGMPRLAVQAEAGTVVAAEWLPGSVHRGVEKLFESRDYRQILMLVDRHDWLSAFCSEIALAVGVERQVGLTPPGRAQHIRVLLAELTRIAHHLAFLAPLPGLIPPAWRSTAWEWRAEVLDLIEAATGHRIHPMFCQVGGVRQDVPTDWVDRVAEATAPESGRQPNQGWRMRLAALDSPELAAVLDTQYAGVGVLSRSDAMAFGASGPVARASGVDLDLRRDDPCLPYPDFPVSLRQAGDARARMRCLVDELATSLDLAAAAAAHLKGCPGAPVNVRLPKVVRVPEGSAYSWSEGPTGINGYLLVSANDRTPWRLKLRSAGFNNAAAVAAALPGTRESDLAAAIGSFLLICGDVDK
ncbi:MAG: hypothetical protein WCF04_14135 [Candidatus Nanopelagicales bacterium]